MEQQKYARLEMVISMAMFGTLAPFVRQVSLPAAELALYRAILATALVGGYLLFRRSSLVCKGLGEELMLLLLSGAAMAVNWILLFQAYNYTTVSAATLSYYFAPVIVTAVCPILFRETMTRRQILCFLMSTLGLVLIVGNSGLSGKGTDLIGILFGLGAAVFYAAVILLNKFIRKVAGLQRTLFQFLAAIAVLIPYVAVTGGSHLSALDGTGWVCLLIVGLVHTGITYCLYFSSLKDLPGQTAAILSYIDPLVAVIVSVLVLGEGITAAQVLGGALVLGFACWNEISPKHT